MGRRSEACDVDGARPGMTSADDAVHHDRLGASIPVEAHDFRVDGRLRAAGAAVVRRPRLCGLLGVHHRHAAACDGAACVRYDDIGSAVEDHHRMRRRGGADRRYVEVGGNEPEPGEPVGRAAREPGRHRGAARYPDCDTRAGSTHAWATRSSTRAVAKPTSSSPRNRHCRIAASTPFGVATTSRSRRRARRSRCTRPAGSYSIAHRGSRRRAPCPPSVREAGGRGTGGAHRPRRDRASWFPWCSPRPEYTVSRRHSSTQCRRPKTRVRPSRRRHRCTPRRTRAPTAPRSSPRSSGRRDGTQKQMRRGP